MAEGNGEVVEEMANQKSGEGGDGERTQDYSKLLEYGLHKMVSNCPAVLSGIIVPPGSSLHSICSYLHPYRLPAGWTTSTKRASWPTRN